MKKVSLVRTFSQYADSFGADGFSFGQGYGPGIMRGYNRGITNGYDFCLF